jgi:hypothetical protein
MPQKFVLEPFYVLNNVRCLHLQVACAVHIYSCYIHDDMVNCSSILKTDDSVIFTG